MFDSGIFIFLTNQDISFFEKLFDERKSDRDNSIMLPDFKEIIFNHKKFNRLTCSDYIDRLRKLKDRQGGLNENEILIKEVFLEHTKRINERDPELKNLFELLSNEGSCLSRKNIIDIIFQFELPIKSDDFFYPIGKKETLTFEDFCLLFKREKEDVLLKSSGGFFSQDSNSESAFPVTVIKFKKV